MTCTSVGGGAGVTGTAGATGAGGAAGAASPIVINEVESNGDPVGDWVELTNVSAATVDISGWKLKDNDDTHAFVVVPDGTTLAPGGFLLHLRVPDVRPRRARHGAPLRPGRQPRRLVQLDDARRWAPTAAAPTAPGRSSTRRRRRARPNACARRHGWRRRRRGRRRGADRAAGGLAANEFPWPGTDTVITVDDAGAFASNLSGLSYQPATATDPAVLWGIQNGPSKLYRLLWNGTTWESDPTNSWSAGKTIHYLDGLGDPDSEGVTKAEFADASIYVSTERDNDNNQVNRFSVLRYDTTAGGHRPDRAQRLGADRRPARHGHQPGAGSDHVHPRHGAGRGRLLRRGGQRALRPGAATPTTARACSSWGSSRTA